MSLKSGIADVSVAPLGGEGWFSVLLKLRRVRVKKTFRLACIAVVTLAFSGLFLVGPIVASSPVDDQNAVVAADEGSSSASLEHPQSFNRKLKPLVTAIDYHTRMIYIFDYVRDKVVIVNPLLIKGWPGDVPLQHTLLSSDGKTVYVTTDNTPDDPAYLITLKIKNINWKHRTASL